MGVQLNIGLPFLGFRPGVAQFLASNLGLARALGRSERLERSFVGATAPDGSTVRQLREGLGGVGEDDRFRFSEDGVGARPGAGQVPLEFATSLRFEDIPIEFRSNLRSVAFLSRNTRVLRLLNALPPTALDVNLSGIDSIQAVEGRVVQLALDRLNSQTPVTEAFLADNFEQALLLALNLGGIADFLNEDPTLARAFVSQGKAVAFQAVQQRVADQVAALFPENAPINREFLVANPRIALFLAQNPARAESLARNEAEARQFVQTAADLNTRLEGTVVNQALDLLGPSQTFNREFFESNPDFAAFLVADNLVAEGESLADFLNARGALLENPRNIGRLLEQRIASQAAGQLPEDFPLGEEFFRDNLGVAILVNASQEFRESFAAAGEEIARFIQPQPAPVVVSPAARHAINAFAVGVAERGLGLIDFFA